MSETNGKQQKGLIIPTFCRGHLSRVILHTAYCRSRRINSGCSYTTEKIVNKIEGFVYALFQCGNYIPHKPSKPIGSFNNKDSPKKFFL